jgi:CheY-like chemotaxis protein
VRIINKVLLIEDNETDCFLSTLILKSSGFVKEILVKKNGQQALAYLGSECFFEDKYPSLILLDLKMPDMDGFKFLKEYEKLEISKKINIAIAILSYSEDGNDIIKLKNLGRYHFIPKPLTEDKLVDLYHRYFRNWVFPENASLIIEPENRKPDSGKEESKTFPE